ncbi:MAG TPA: DEAD/DEAH box helicase, partial [Candidatus Nitrosotenuis sp.]|nr:DEAD/DEAH box helicase [Candidatus Nitrosotenuis sp.]
MIYQVLLPLAVDRPFSYLAPEPLVMGQLVKVPFRGKEMVGVVWSHNKDNYTGDLKSISTIFPWHLPKVMKQFITWVADYNLAPLGSVLKMAIPSTALAEKKSRHPLTLPTFLCHQSLASLSLEQSQVTQQIKESLNQFSPFLLHGVTGSGKTEVYFHVLDEIIRSGKQALVLLPEIALTSQWLSRFEQRFKAPPFLWHSHLTESTRRQTWQAVLKGEAQIIVGARSALFLPFPNLGLIIVDEEHDHSFKQEEQVLYHARDMA